MFHFGQSFGIILLKMFLLAVILTLLAVSSGERVYPCADTPTQECFANYLAIVASCVARTQLPESNVLTTPDTKVEIPYFRATINRYDTNAEIAHDFELDDLYYDTIAQVTVLTTVFQSAKLTGRVLVDYHRPGEVDVELDTEWSILYNNIVATAVYDGVEQITLETAKLNTQIESFSLNLDADFSELEDALAEDSTGVIAAVQKLFLEHQDIYLREHEPATGRQLWVPFFEKYLCSL